MQQLEVHFTRDLSPESRVWVYQSDRRLEKNEQEQLSQEIDAFVQNWAAHGNGLFADFTFVSPYNLIVAVDDSKVPPSGCSIDAFVRFLTSLGTKHSIDFFVRMKVVAFDGNDWSQLSFEDVSEKAANIRIIDPTIDRLNQLVKSGLTEPQHSGLKTLF